MSDRFTSAIIVAAAIVFGVLSGAVENRLRLVFRVVLPHFIEVLHAEKDAGSRKKRDDYQHDRHRDWSDSHNYNMSFVRQARADEFLQEASTDRIETRLQEKQNTCQALFRDRGAHARRFHCQPPQNARRLTNIYELARSKPIGKKRKDGGQNRRSYERGSFLRSSNRVRRDLFILTRE